MNNDQKLVLYLAVIAILVLIAIAIAGCAGADVAPKTSTVAPVSIATDAGDVPVERADLREKTRAHSPRAATSRPTPLFPLPEDPNHAD